MSTLEERNEEPVVPQQQAAQQEKQEDDEDVELPMFNFGYVLARLKQATDLNNDTKVKKWSKFLQSHGSGILSVGTRTPVANIPAWVTLEVAQGGFSTGGLMAGGPLQSHEEELYKHFFNEAPTSEEACREKLNTEFLTARGLVYLSTLLSTAQYIVNAPEEGALLTFVWLANNNFEADAASLVEIIQPLFNRLRFYPVPSATPLSMGTSVSVAPVLTVYDTLANVHTPALMLRNRSVIYDVIPFCDSLVATVMKTIQGPVVPNYVTENGKQELVGDLPFQVESEEVKQALRNLVNDFDKMPVENRKTQRFSKGYTGKLLEIVRKYLENNITSKNREFAKKILASFNQRRGLPGSPRLAEARKNQQKTVEKVGIYDDFAAILTARLSSFKSKPGLENIIQPVKSSEATNMTAEGSTIPEALVEKVKRCKLAPIEDLCEEGLVPSEEVLAILCPALVAAVAASGHPDRTLATLYGAVYRAFKNRRSLLLLDLSSQVRITELPWVSLLDKHRAVKSGRVIRSEASKETLQDVVQVALRYWPETMLPNKFVGVLEDLSEEAFPRTRSEKPRLPLIKELASDIFRGTFAGSSSYLFNAKIAAEMLQGSIYEKYYGIPYAEVANYTKEQELDALCIKASAQRWGDITANGQAIEKCMIVTTHNLALLFKEFNLKDKLAAALPVLAKRIFEFIIRELKNLTGLEWKVRLQHIKNSAYAFRQLVFYLAQLPNEEVDEFFTWVLPRLDKIKDAAFRTKLSHPVKHLHAVWKGVESPKTCVFTGWVGKGEKHFMMPPSTAQIVINTAAPTPN